MIVWTVHSGAGWLLGAPVDAELRLVVGWVVEPLLPPVTQLALEPVGTAILVLADGLVGRPVGALFCGVALPVGLASELLPVVGKDAGVPVVVSVDVGTPDRLVVEEVEVRVPLELVDQVDADVVVTVRETAVLAVLAETGLGQVALAVLGFVLVWVVEFLHPRVAVPALISVGTGLLFRNEAAHFCCV